MDLLDCGASWLLKTFDFKPKDSRSQCWDRRGREIRHKGTRTTTTNVLGRLQTVGHCLTCTSCAREKGDELQEVWNGVVQEVETTAPP